MIGRLYEQCVYDLHLGLGRLGRLRRLGFAYQDQVLLGQQPGAPHEAL